MGSSDGIGRGLLSVRGALCARTPDGRGKRARPQAAVWAGRSDRGSVLPGRMQLILRAILLAPACLATARAQEAPDAIVDAGPLTLDVRVSRTATLFHVVDQLSLWSPFCHAQYRRYFERPDRRGLSADDLSFLARDLAAAIGPAAVPALFDAYGAERPDPVRIEFWVTLRQLLP